MQPSRARTSSLGVPPLLLARWVGWLAPVRPTHGALVLACPSASLPVHVCALSWATWLLCTDVPAWYVVLHVRCPGPLGSCSSVRLLGALFWVCGVLRHLAPVQRCARLVCCVACAVSLAPWLLFTGVPARCVVLRVRCPWPPGSCSPVCPPSVLCCVCSVLGPLPPVYRCARSVVVLPVRCPGPLGSCSPVGPPGLSCYVYGFLGPLAPFHRCACSVCCVGCAVSLAHGLLITGVPARSVVLCVRCPGPLRSRTGCPLLPSCARFGRGRGALGRRTP